MAHQLTREFHGVARALADPKQCSSNVKVIAGHRYITQETGTDSQPTGED